MDGVLDYHQFYVFISDVHDRSFVKQSCPPARLAVYLVFTTAGLLVEGTRDRNG